VPAFGLVGFYSVLSQWWMGTGRVLVPAACIVVAAAVAAASEIILTSRFGAIGAPISISIGALVAITLLGSFTVFDLAHPRSKGGRDHGVPDPSGAAERLVMPSD
jgi:O-antigen/teichoic acid export membrane protein